MVNGLPRRSLCRLFSRSHVRLGEQVSEQTGTLCPRCKKNGPSRGPFENAFWLGGSAVALSWEALAQELRLKMEIQLDARDTHPSQASEFFNADVAPLVFREPSYVTESNSCLRVVFRHVPGATSNDVEELGQDLGVGVFGLRVQRIFFCSCFESVYQACFVHRKRVRK